VGRIYERIDEHQREWIARQPMFFVGSAPLDTDGHVNVSPKGPIGSLRVLDDHTVAYLDLVGSGAETIAHIRENGRVVVMLCAFEGPPRIVRLHGTGEAVLNDEPRYQGLYAAADFVDPSIPEARRAIVDIEVTRIGDSCGYGVPLMTLEGHREHLPLSADKRIRTMGLDGYEEFQRERGARSLDGLPALPPRR
jgi:hypothetical protein